ncbi:Oxygen-independent coproporphyrinogen-III oxidase [Ensifer sesbaniae]|nr:Oxygen-independent coproporphyrinogen-III oxidase [Ensifer sesbaniae]
MADGEKCTLDASAGSQPIGKEMARATRARHRAVGRPQSLGITPQTAIPTKYREAHLPWYTIYPTVSQFSPAVGANAWGEWLRDIPAEDAVSLYLHIPFCRSMCWYCGFPVSITRRDASILNYLAVLREEIRLVSKQAPQGLPVSDVHFGGGTPTLMPPAEFLALMEILRSYFAFKKAATVAVEIDPRTFTPEMAEALEAAGVNRASLGVQSFDPIVQRAINRVQSETQVAVAAENLRRLEYSASISTLCMVFRIKRCSLVSRAPRQQSRYAPTGLPSSATRTFHLIEKISA